MTTPLAEHLDRLHEGVRGLRSRAARPQERWLLVAGGIALPLGIGLIVLGWYGTAQTPLVFEQTPYLVSGGLLGLALVVTGALLYAVYWLTRLVRDGREEAARTAAHQERVEAALTAIAEGLQARSTSARPQRLVVTAEGSMLHRPDCVATQGQAVTTAGPARAGLPLCGLCRPEPPRARARRGSAA